MCAAESMIGATIAKVQDAPPVSRGAIRVGAMVPSYIPPSHNTMIPPRPQRCISGADVAHGLSSW